MPSSPPRRLYPLSPLLRSSAGPQGRRTGAGTRLEDGPRARQVLRVLLSYQTASVVAQATPSIGTGLPRGMAVEGLRLLDGSLVLKLEPGAAAVWPRLAAGCGFDPEDGVVVQHDLRVGPRQFVRRLEGACALAAGNVPRRSGGRATGRCRPLWRGWRSGGRSAGFRPRSTARADTSSSQPGGNRDCEGVARRRCTMRGSASWHPDTRTVSGKASVVAFAGLPETGVDFPRVIDGVECKVWHAGSLSMHPRDLFLLVGLLESPELARTCRGEAR